MQAMDLEGRPPEEQINLLQKILEAERKGRDDDAREARRAIENASRLEQQREYARQVRLGYAIGPSKARKDRSPFNLRRPKGMYSEKQLEIRENFRDPKWREENLYGKRESLVTFLGHKGITKSMRYDTKRGARYRISSAAKGLLRSKRSRRKWWPWLEGVVPAGARSITDLDAAKAMAAYEHSRKAKSVRKSFSVKRENPF